MRALAPLIVGSIAILAVAILLFIEEPAPGPLAAAHADIGETLADCTACHTPDGLDAGCLACHDEIATSKYHRHLGAIDDCARCHADHHGRGFDLLALAWEEDGRGFDHPHVAFDLAGKHDELECAACHKATFLGLDQQCTTCHENIHRAARFAACTKCHDQEAFVPAARFDHTPHLSLAKGHKSVACDKCHSGASYDRVRGKRCADCHDDPHKTPFGRDCEACHDADAAPWSAAAEAFDHARTSFALTPPHDNVTCKQCHAGETYAARFREPARAAGECRTCHGDPHKGQFADRACAACHEDHAFTPSRITHATHPTFALKGAHTKAACDRCHQDDLALGARRYVATPHACAACHEDPHKGQFGARTCRECHGERAFKPSSITHASHAVFALKHAHAKAKCEACHKDGRFAGAPQQCASCHEDPHNGQFKGRACAVCHDERAFLPAHYGLARHDTFPLTGGHQAVACRTCHQEERGVRRFVGTARACKSCHEDVHGGQFGRADDCTKCHAADASTFRIRPFDHSVYPLVGAHAKADCARCHETRGGVRRYRGTPKRCADCHADVHRGQLKRKQCEACHVVGDSFRLPSFDHGKTRFPLDARHRDVACTKCHPTVRQRDGTAVVQYRPLGRQCGDCHDFK